MKRETISTKRRRAYVHHLSNCLVLQLRTA